MAFSYDNEITKNYHGMMGGIVFRCRGNMSIMSKRPDCSRVVKTKAQKDNMKRFAAAIIYAKGVLKDPELREKYENIRKENQSIWNAAISNFLSKPKVEEIDVDGYEGLQGNVIKISAWDKYKVVAVIVTILNFMGHVIESGAAVARPLSGGMEWDYKTTVMNPSYKGSRVVVRVVDLPGNVVQETIVIDST
jgi:hypothetical protein